MKFKEMQARFPLMKSMGADRKKQFNEYFSTAPDWLFDSFTMEKVKKENRFIKEGQKVDTIYMVLDGMIKATDYRFNGFQYDYMFANKLYAYGGMEIILDLDRYQASMQTVTDCLLLKIPAGEFQRWITSDLIALKHESSLMGEYLLEQHRECRAFLFLQGADRLAFLLTRRYKQYAENNLLTLQGNRQKLSDCTGLCVKTVTRALKRFREEGLVTLEGSRIYVDQTQYQGLKKMVDQVLFED